MKTLLTAIILVLSTSEIIKAGITINTTVSFGAKSKGCSGFGICSATTSKNGSTAVWNYNNAAAGQLVLQLSDAVSNNLPAIILNDLKAGRFVQEEILLLPQALLNSLGIQGKNALDKGVYSVVHTAGAYNIPFNLTSQ